MNPRLAYRIYHVVQTVLKLVTILFPPPGCWGDEHAPPGPLPALSLFPFSNLSLSIFGLQALTAVGRPVSKQAAQSR